MAEQAALDAHDRLPAAVTDRNRNEQVEHDVVVVAGIERDAVARAGLDHAANDIERAIAVERRNLDGNDVFDLRKTPPERYRQHDAADGRLQIKSDQRNFPRDRFRVRDQVIFARAFHGGERQKPGVIADAARDLRFLDGLCRAPGKAGDHDRLGLAPVRGRAHREFQHRLIESDIADRELRGVDADRQAAGAGVEIVARQRALAPRIELALGVKRERMRWNDNAATQRVEHR